MSVVRDIPFVSYPGFRPVSLDLHRPADDGAVPVIVELHGGGWRMGSRGVFTPLVSEAHSFGRIVAAGFAVVAVDYRLSAEAQFPAQVDDVIAALDWVVANADRHGLDASRVVLWGGSAGGTLAALAAIRWSGALRGVIDWYGPSDLQAMPRGDEPTREDLWLGASVPSIPDAALAASPARQVRAGLPPFHIAHGADDTDVPLAQSEGLARALESVGVEVELHVEPAAGHFWRGATEEATDALFDRAIAFATRVTA